MKLFGEIENYCILLDEEEKFMIIDVLGPGGYEKGVLATHEFRGNTIKLSECLRDQIGFGPALAFLDAQGVPENHNLRYLGRGWDWKK